MASQPPNSAKELSPKPPHKRRPALGKRPPRFTDSRNDSCLLGLADFPISVFEFPASALFQIPLPTIAICQCQPHAHESGGWQKQQQHCFINCSLPAFGTRFHITGAHCAPLAERRWRYPQPSRQNNHGQNCSAKFHFILRACRNPSLAVISLPV